MNRRDFLAATSAAGLGLSAFDSFAAFADKPPRVGLIGTCEQLESW
jgi:hypothetical protein